MAKRTPLLFSALLALTCLPAGAARADCGLPGVESVACPSLTGLGATSWVNDISADGHTVVGSLNDLPMRWVDGVAQPLGPLPPEFNSEASAIAAVADGSLIVGHGYYLHEPPSTQMSGAFTWTPETGVQTLPLPGWNPVISSVSEDGLVIGRSCSTARTRCTCRR